MKNILAQAKEKGVAAGNGVDAGLLKEPTENGAGGAFERACAAG